MTTPLTVVCWKWGPLFSAEYVNRLRAMVDRHLSIPHEVACITDDPRGIDPRVRLVELPNAFSRMSGCLPRMHQYDGPWARAHLGERILSLDLDLVIVDDLTPLVDRPEPFVCWLVGYCQQYAGGMVLMDAGALQGVWEDFITNPVRALRHAIPTLGELSPAITDPVSLVSDQNLLNVYLRATYPEGVPSWTEADGLVPSPQACQARLPAGSRIAFFRHETMPVMEEQRFPWIARHWSVDAPPPEPEPPILTCVPYATDQNLGRAYNAIMAALPDDGWACLLDHDVTFTTTMWYRQLVEAIRAHPDGAFTAVTNRITCPWQQAAHAPAGDDLAAHGVFGRLRLQDTPLRDVTDAAPWGGFLMLLSKAAWTDAGGFVDGLLCVDHQMMFALREAGRRIYCIEGLYVYHRHASAATPGLPVARDRRTGRPCPETCRVLPAGPAPERGLEALGANLPMVEPAWPPAPNVGRRAPAAWAPLAPSVTRGRAATPRRRLPIIERGIAPCAH